MQNKRPWSRQNKSPNRPDKTNNDNDPLDWCIVTLINSLKLYLPLSLSRTLKARKSYFGVSDQVWHKPACTVTEEGKSLQISDLRRREIVTAQLICVFVFVYAEIGVYLSLSLSLIRGWRVIWEDMQTSAKRQTKTIDSIGTEFQETTTFEILVFERIERYCIFMEFYSCFSTTIMYSVIQQYCLSCSIITCGQSHQENMSIKCIPP